MPPDNYENELVKVRGELRATKLLVGSLIGHLEKNARYKLIETMQSEISAIGRNRRKDVEASEELTEAEYQRELSEFESEAEFVNEAFKYAASLKNKPYLG